MFSQGGLAPSSLNTSTSTTTDNPMKDFEVVSPPEDSTSALAFNPATIPTNLLIAGSWDNCVRCWEVEQTGKTILKSMQNIQAPVLDVAWHDDGTKVFIASCDNAGRCWDLTSNQVTQIATHDAPIRTCHWIKSPSYSCLMTGSWDKTLKFWDLRSPSPMMTINLPERCYCADVDYPMAVVGTAGRVLIIYELEGTPHEFRRVDPPFKFQHHVVAIFRDRVTKKTPAGFAVGSVEGRVAIQYKIIPKNPKDNFKFKCHRSTQKGTRRCHQDVYAVNDIAFHPVHGTLATVGSDGTFSFWDIYAHTLLKTSEPMGQPIIRCCFNHNGQIFAYSVGYDWSKGHEYNTIKKNHIFLRSCFEELKPRSLV